MEGGPCSLGFAGQCSGTACGTAGEAGSAATRNGGTELGIRQSASRRTNASTPAPPGGSRTPRAAVYLTYAAPAGYAFIDRAFYLPRSWTSDPDRCAAAGVPDDVQFATKPAQATAMIIRALDAGTPARWAAGDEVYGADPGLRKELIGRRLGYVLAIAKDHPITTGIGTRRADDLAARLPKRAWQRLSAGKGAKGERFYDWTLVDTIDTAADPETAGRHWLLIRRNRHAGELAYYRASCPTPVRLAALVKSPAPAGKSKSPSSPARNSPAWTSTRSAAGPPGTAGQSWPCSPTPSSR